MENSKKFFLCIGLLVYKFSPALNTFRCGEPFYCERDNQPAHDAAEESFSLLSFML
jgi:hypothetical protein